MFQQLKEELTRLSATSIIDVWNPGTFDEQLRASLDANASLIRDYTTTDRRNFEEREASDRLDAYPENPFASDYMSMKEEVILPLLEARTIRAWHYTRMTDGECDAMLRDGIYLSSLDTITFRFGAQVAMGTFSQEVADRLFAESPYQSDQRAARVGKFWMVSDPQRINNSGVQPLLTYWGGESAYFWQQDEALREVLRNIGRSRVVEVAVPIAATQHAYRAVEAVVAAFGRHIGCNTESGAFDLYAVKALGPRHILAIHSEGEATFAAMACGYPETYLRVGSVGATG